MTLIPGEITSGGVLTAGTAAGTYTGAVEAAVGAVSGTADLVVSATDEPVYNAGTSTLIYAGDPTDAAYSSATNAGALTQNHKHMIPASSPLFDGNAVDTVRQNITTGKGGSGLALQAIYPTNGAQQGPGWVLYQGGSVAAAKTSVFRCQIKMDVASSLTGEFAVKFMRLMTQGQSGGSAPQWSTHNHLPWTGGVHPTYWQVYQNSYTDSGTYPNGSDQATQPVGPYFNDLLGDGLWHRFTFAWRAHSAVGVYDGFQRMWIDGVKVLDCSNAAVGVTPAGGEKQWTDSNMVQNCLVNDSYGATYGWHLGGTQTTLSQPQVTFSYNLGNADPTNFDTLAAWYDP